MVSVLAAQVVIGDPALLRPDNSLLSVVEWAMLDPRAERLPVKYDRSSESETGLETNLMCLFRGRSKQSL